MPPKTSKIIEDKIEELSNSGLTVTEVAKEVGVTTKVVRRVEKERGLTFAKANNSRPSEEFELEVLRLFNFGHNTKYISTQMNISQLQVNRILKRNGVKSIPKNQLNVTIDDELKICELYKRGFSTNDIADIFSDKIKCDRTISKILKKNGVKVSTSGSNAIIENEDYFENIDTEEKAYLLGFIYADGNITFDNRGNHIFQMELQTEDAYILEFIRNSVGCFVKEKDFNNLTVNYIPKPIYRIERVKNGKLSKTSSIQIISKKIFDDLNKHGVVENKTFKVTFPKDIDSDLVRHFIRGYFDGDGSPNCSKGRGRITFYGQPKFLNYIKDILYRELNTNIVNVFDKKAVSMLSYGSKKDVSAIYNYLYKNSNIHLERKRLKLQPYVNTEITN